jgi:hypothetical protein
MEQTTSAPTALLVPDAAALIGARPVDVYEAVAVGDIGHTLRVFVNVEDVRAWHANRDAS